MKKLFALLLAVVMVFSLVACAKTPAPAVEKTDATNNADAPKKLKIGWSLNALDVFMTELHAYVKDYVEAAGYELVMINANAKTDQQLADIDNLITQQCDVILVNASDSTAVVPGVEAALAAGIPVVDAGTNIQTQCTVQCVGKQFEWGAAQGQYVADYLDANPDATLKVGYVWGKMGLVNAVFEHDGFMSVVQPYIDSGRMEIVAEKDCEWTTTKAIAATEDWLQAHPDMNCIISQSDEMALGVTQVLNNAGVNFDEFIVVSIDGSESGLHEVKDGRLDFTVMSPKKDYAEQIAQAAIDVVVNPDKYEAGAIVPVGDTRFCTPETCDDLLAEFYG